MRHLYGRHRLPDCPITLHKGNALECTIYQNDALSPEEGATQQQRYYLQIIKCVYNSASRGVIHVHKTSIGILALRTANRACDKLPPHREILTLTRLLNLIFPVIAVSQPSIDRVRLSESLRCCVCST